jgi:hypothetical protein
MMTSRAFFVLSLLAVMPLSSCRREPEVTPEQEKQLQVLRDATYAGAERLLGRPLTADEKECVVVRLVDGKPDGHVKDPLAGRLKARQQELLKRETSTTSPAAP